MTTPAQDEFQSLIARNSAVSRASHPEDDSDLVSETTTIAPSLRPSVRSSALSSSKTKSRPLSAASEASFYNHDSSDDDAAPAPRSTSAAAKQKYYLPATYDRDAMTGPKGVIADAQAFEREKRGKRSTDFKRTMDLALPRSQAYGGASGPSSRKNSESEATGGAASDHSAPSSDEEVVRQWRERRMEEMRSRSAKRGGSSRRDPYHGTFENVTPIRFLDAVETAGRGSVVVVYIFDESQPSSDAYAQYIAALAKKHTSVHFVALHHLDAEIDSAGVPALLAYMNGHKFADVLPLQDEVPLTCNVMTTLEDVMKQRGMIS